MIKLPEVKKRRRAVKYIDGLVKYFGLPEQILISRKKHWPYFQDILINIKKNKLDPKENFRNKVFDIARKSKKGRTNRSKATKVCIAASIYEDLTSYDEHSWKHNYESAMSTAYDILKTENDSIIDSII